VTRTGGCTRDKNRHGSNPGSALSRKIKAASTGIAKPGPEADRCPRDCVSVLLALQEVLQRFFNKLIRPPSFY
jgi:hypothetical protein